MKRIILVCMVLLLVPAGCSSNSGDIDPNNYYGSDTYRFTAEIVDQAGDKNIVISRDYPGVKYAFTVKDYSPSFEIFKQYNDSYPSTNTYRQIYLMDNSQVYKLINNNQKVEVRPEELSRGTKIELWVSSFGISESYKTEMFVHAKEVNILP